MESEYQQLRNKIDKFKAQIKEDLKARFLYALSLYRDGRGQDAEDWAIALAEYFSEPEGKGQWETTVSDASIASRADPFSFKDLKDKLENILDVLRKFMH